MNKVIVLSLTGALVAGCAPLPLHDDSIPAFVPPPLYRQGPAQTTELRQYVPDEAPAPVQPPARLQLASNDPTPPAVQATPLPAPGATPSALSPVGAAAPATASSAPVVAPAATGAPTPLAPVGVAEPPASKVTEPMGAPTTKVAAAVATPATQTPAAAGQVATAPAVASAPPPTPEEEDREPPPPPLPTWKWKAGDDLVKVFVEWTKTAGKTPRVLTPAHWRLLTDEQLTAPYEDALEELLEGSSHDSPVPKAEIAPNGLVTLRSFIK